MSTPLLEVRGVSRLFRSGEGTFAALDQVDLTIQAGEMVAIVGASGSGKSTLMHILGCLDRPSAGIFRIAGRNTAELDADELAALRRERFGFVFQRCNLLPQLTALENVQVPASYAGLERRRRMERGLALLERLQIRDRATHRPNQLSGGQQQRVSIARALMNGGEVIFADEPTGALDSHAGAEVLSVLTELNAQGHTIILVTHDRDIAHHARRIVEISDGRIVSDVRATPEVSRVGAEVRERPVSRPARFAALADALRTALITMRARLLRSVLTMLGIVIGITSVVSVVALGQGGQEQVLAQIRAIGTNMIEVYGGSRGEMRLDGPSSLSIADAKAISELKHVEGATPALTVSNSLRWGNRTIQATGSGVGEEYFRVRDVPVAAGRTFSASERESLAQVVVIGAPVRAALFPPAVEPVGQVILVGKTPFRVVGVVQKNNPFSPAQSFSVWMPYTSVMGRLTGNERISSISVRVADQGSMAQVADSIQALLHRRHNKRDDFHLLNTDVVRKSVESATQTMTLLVAAIALISLIVGGIGVMNIMLVSVTERTREIGIRTAVGARRGDILRQFLTEAILICAAGGLLGVFAAYGFRFVFERFVPQYPMIFSTASIVAAIAVSTLMGLISGIVPARNAARLDPIEALASE